MFSLAFINTMIVKTIISWKLLCREFMYKLISTANIVHTYFSLIKFSVHSHSLILRYYMIPDYIHHPMVCLRRYSNCGLANGVVVMSACCLFVSTETIFDAPCLMCSIKWCHLMEICFFSRSVFWFFCELSCSFIVFKSCVACVPRIKFHPKYTGYV